MNGEENKKKILDQQPNEKELEAVQGGFSLGTGNCSGAYYVEKCTATVEKNSWCSSDDWCAIADSTYEMTEEAKKENVFPSVQIII